MNVELTHVKTEYQAVISYMAYYRNSNPFGDSDRDMLMSYRKKTFDKFEYDVNKPLSEQIISYLSATIRSEDATEITFSDVEVYEINTYKSSSGILYYTKQIYSKLEQEKIKEVIRFAPKGQR